MAARRLRPLLAVISLALLLIGFSLFSAISMALTHFRCDHGQSPPLARLMGLLLLSALGALQLAHFGWLYLDQPWVDTLPYRMALYVVAPSFFLFSQPLLHPQSQTAVTPALLWHALPLLLAAWLPGNVALPLAFMVGAAYLLWLGRRLLALRAVRANFQQEILLLGAVFVIAVTVSLLGLVQSALPARLFFCLYASAIGAAFFLVQTTLLLRPALSAEVAEAVQGSYASSTLGNVDCAAALSRLAQLMQQQKRYQDAALSLARLAGELDLSTHQLSELMNARLGKSFSRYLREQRIAAARQMLLDEASASVLSVGLSVGFTSQSTFYEAFREIEGMTPGQYRKLNAGKK